jgi:hypothetical protein
MNVLGGPRPDRAALSYADPLFLGLVGLLFFSATGLSAQEREQRVTHNAHISGVVLDRVTEEPVSAVEIVLRSGADAPVWSGVTDLRGRFRITLLPVGDYQLTFRRLGYATTTESLSVGAGIEADVRVRLGPEAVELESVVVTTTRRSRLDGEGFYQRQRYFQGEFFLREHIEDRNPVVVQDLLRMVPGFHFRMDLRGGSVTPVVFGGRGCPPEVPGCGGCHPAIFLNGMRMEYAPGDPSIPDPFEMVPPDQLEAMEVYRGQMTPAQFNTGGACGAIAMWTRIGYDRDHDEVGRRDRRRPALLAGFLLVGLRLILF